MSLSRSVLQPELLTYLSSRGCCVLIMSQKPEPCQLHNNSAAYPAWDLVHQVSPNLSSFQSISQCLTGQTKLSHCQSSFHLILPKCTCLRISPQIIHFLISITGKLFRVQNHITVSQLQECIYRGKI